MPFDTISNTDPIDLIKVKTLAQSETKTICNNMDEQLAGCYTMQKATSAKQMKINHIDGFEFHKATQRKEKAPNEQMKYGSTYMRDCAFHAEICFDGRDLMGLPSDILSKVNTKIGHAWNRLNDKELMYALCAPLLCGEECNIQKVPLSADNFIADDSLGLTIAKLLDAQTRINLMCPGMEMEPVVIGVTQMQLNDLRQYDEFTNNDFLVTESMNQTGMFPKMWSNIRFKYISDHKKAGAKKFSDSTYHATTKIDLNFYGPGIHRRWLPVWRASSLYKSNLLNLKIDTRDLAKAEGLWSGSFAIKAEGIFGFGRCDNDGVVWIPVREENPYLNRV